MNGVETDGGPSPEALAYRSRYVPELELDDVNVGGVECLRVRSANGGTANGTLVYI